MLEGIHDLVGHGLSAELRLAIVALLLDLHAPIDCEVDARNRA